VIDSSVERIRNALTRNQNQSPPCLAISEPFVPNLASPRKCDMLSVAWNGRRSQDKVIVQLLEEVHWILGVLEKVKLPENRFSGNFLRRAADELLSFQLQSPTSTDLTNLEKTQLSQYNGRRSNHHPLTIDNKFQDGSAQVGSASLVSILSGFGMSTGPGVL
jgi:hypothetical protein